MRRRLYAENMTATITIYFHIRVRRLFEVDEKSSDGKERDISLHFC